MGIKLESGVVRVCLASVIHMCKRELSHQISHSSKAEAATRSRSETAESVLKVGVGRSGKAPGVCDVCPGCVIMNETVPSTCATVRCIMHRNSYTVTIQYKTDTLRHDRVQKMKVGGCAVCKRPCTRARNPSVSYVMRSFHGEPPSRSRPCAVCSLSPAHWYAPPLDLRLVGVATLPFALARALLGPPREWTARGGGVSPAPCHAK